MAENHWDDRKVSMATQVKLVYKRAPLKSGALVKFVSTIITSSPFGIVKLLLLVQEVMAPLFPVKVQLSVPSATWLVRASGMVASATYTVTCDVPIEPTCETCRLFAVQSFGDT